MAKYSLVGAGKKALKFKSFKGPHRQAKLGVAALASLAVGGFALGAASSNKNQDVAIPEGIIGYGAVGIGALLGLATVFAA